MPIQIKFLLHLEGQCLGCFIIYSDGLVTATHCEKSSVGFEVQSIEVVLRIFLDLVKTFSGSCVPMLKRTISLASN
jgi:hypothetical protein